MNKQPQPGFRRHVIFFTYIVLMFCWLVAGICDQPLTLPVNPAQRGINRRPEWLSRDGIIMAGSWEPLLFRIRRDGSDGYTPTPAQRAGYEREHSPDMIAQLKSLGVNWVMMHGYKAFGTTAERQSMEDAARFTKLCHDAGLRVGVYTSSGTLGWELLYKEKPDAREWALLDAHGQPIPYGSAKYRYYYNRNHPGLVAYLQNIIRFVVERQQADLLHFDNYCVGPGTDDYSVQSFRDYLRRTFTTRQREQMGIKDIESVKPPLSVSSDKHLRMAWQDFSCQWLADSYHDLCRYARSLRPDILVELNPGGPSSRIIPPIDHGRLLTSGEAFWDEGASPGYHNNKLQTRIRTFKVARRMNQIAFAYTTTPLEAAEAMAFNLDCLGCICWFEYGNIVALPGSSNPISPDLQPYIRFYKTRRELFRNTTVVADVAVWRSFASQVFADPKHAQLTAAVEQRLIEDRVPFQIIYDQQLNDLKRYRVLILAGCVALSDAQIRQIRNYVRAGGRICIIGPTATFDQWMNPAQRGMNPRTKNPFAGLPAEDVVSVAQTDDPDPLVGDDWMAALSKARGLEMSVSVRGSPGLCMEITAQSNRRLVHLVNYDSNHAAREIAVRLRLPSGKKVRNVLLAGPERAGDIELPFSVQGDFVAFTVPAVKIYEIAIVQFR